MQQIFKLLILLLVLPSIGCQSPIWHPLSKEALKTSLHQKKAHNLLMQGKLNYNLARQQQLIECNNLKTLYKANANWQTAWLLVYSFKDSCINAKKKISLLKEMNTEKKPSIQILWLNNHYISLLTELNDLKKLQKKNDFLRSQLKNTRKQLKKENSKIEALKEIETSINKKLEHE